MIVEKKILSLDSIPLIVDLISRDGLSKDVKFPILGNKTNFYNFIKTSNYETDIDFENILYHREDFDLNKYNARQTEIDKVVMFDVLDPEDPKGEHSIPHSIIYKYIENLAYSIVNHSHDTSITDSNRQNPIQRSIYSVNEDGEDEYLLEEDLETQTVDISSLEIKALKPRLVYLLKQLALYSCKDQFDYFALMRAGRSLNQSDKKMDYARQGLFRVNRTGGRSATIKADTNASTYITKEHINWALGVYPEDISYKYASEAFDIMEKVGIYAKDIDIEKFPPSYFINLPVKEITTNSSYFTKEMEFKNSIKRITLDELVCTRKQEVESKSKAQEDMLLLMNFMTAISSEPDILNRTSSYYSFESDYKELQTLFNANLIDDITLYKLFFLNGLENYKELTELRCLAKSNGELFRLRTNLLSDFNVSNNTRDVFISKELGLLIANNSEDEVLFEYVEIERFVNAIKKAQYAIYNGKVPEYFAWKKVTS